MNDLGMHTSSEPSFSLFDILFVIVFINKNGIANREKHSFYFCPNLPPLASDIETNTITLRLQT
jgi:hypothetical protein